MSLISPSNEYFWSAEGLRVNGGDFEVKAKRNEQILTHNMDAHIHDILL